MYHRFDENRYPSTNIKMSDFIKQLDLIKKNNFKFISAEQFENSLKNVKRNFKASNYLAIATIFFLTGSSLVFSNIFQDQYFIQALIYFSFALFSVLIFILIIWRILK